MKEERQSMTAADDIDVVRGAESPSVPQRTLVPPVVTGSVATAPLPHEPVARVEPSYTEPARSPAHLRAVERPAPAERREHDPVTTVVETVGAAVGWTTGYVKSRRPADMRSDAERFVVASPALALVAALGFGFLLGSYMRR